MMLIRSALLLALAMAGRLNQNVLEEGKIPCGCNNKVGLLAPKEKLEGIDIAPDAECAKPGVHASKTPGRFCSCDEGAAKNWDVAVTAAQKRLDDALQPKIEALKGLMQQLQEKLGIQIDSSSIGKVKPKVTSFPREEGAGLWVCCCQSQAAGKCKKNAEMENGWIKRGVHHAAPERACEDEFAAPETAEVTEPDAEPDAAPSVEPSVEPPETTLLSAETEGSEEEVTDQEESNDEETGSEEEVTDQEESNDEETGSEEEVTDQEESNDEETGSEEEVTDQEESNDEETGEAFEAPEVDAIPSPVPAPPAPPVSDSRSALLRQIQEGTKLKKSKAAPSPPTPAAPAPAPARGRLLNEIQGGVQLKPVKAREPPKPREDLMSQIKAGIQLKPPKKRTPKVTTTRVPTLLDTLQNSPKFQAMSEHMNSEAETAEEEEEDWD